MTVNRNIRYRSEAIPQYYSKHRRCWSAFYQSERWVFSHVADASDGFGDLLDVGCACGGLGAALTEANMPMRSYTGVDVSDRAISWANTNHSLLIPTRFLAADILSLQFESEFDTVVSLSCADWCMEPVRVVQACWNALRPGGVFVMSLRLTERSSINNIEISYQWVAFPELNNSGKDQEKANYVVFNVFDALSLLSHLSPAPAGIGAYGYWGTPSITAHTPFDRIAFSVLWVRKPHGPPAEDPAIIPTELHLPFGLLKPEYT